MSTSVKTAVVSLLLGALLTAYGYVTWRAMVAPTACPERGCEVQK